MLALVADIEEEIKTESGRITEWDGNVQMCGYATPLHYDGGKKINICDRIHHNESQVERFFFF